MITSQARPHYRCPSWDDSRQTICAGVLEYELNGTTPDGIQVAVALCVGCARQAEQAIEGGSLLIHGFTVPATLTYMGPIDA